MITSEERKNQVQTTQIILRNDQKEAVDKAVDFLSTLNEKGIETFKATMQGAKMAYDIYNRQH